MNIYLFLLNLAPVTGSGSGSDITSPVSFREERALHYAMARFAEMEQNTPSTSPAATPRGMTPSSAYDENRPAGNVLDMTYENESKEQVHRKRRKRRKPEEEQQQLDVSP
jgi:hypothetical protein